MNALKTVQNLVQIDRSKTVTLLSYSNDPIQTLGTCAFNCKIANDETVLKFHVVNSKANTIIGLPDALKLNLIQLHPDVHEINTKPDHIPVDI